jgi:hypothetical protein
MGSIYLFIFVVYLTTLLVSQAIWRRMIGLLINNELETTYIYGSGRGLI